MMGSTCGHVSSYVSQYSNRPSYMCSVHRGTPEDKLRIIFDAYDEDRSGEIDERKMRRMLTSTLAIESKARRAMLH